jgi:hypothetical protein
VATRRGGGREPLADGRFLINVTAGDAVTAPIAMIQIWTPKK